MRLGLQVAVLAVVALSAAVFVSAAGAAQPTKIDLPTATFTSTITGVCAFPVSVSYTSSGTETDFVEIKAAP